MPKRTRKVQARTANSTRTNVRGGNKTPRLARRAPRPPRETSLADRAYLAIRDEIVATTYCSEPAEIQSEPLNLRGLTCSIGIATLRRHLGEDLSLADRKSTILRLADAAMYVAKETGRNRTAVAGQPVRRRPLAGA